MLAAMVKVLLATQIAWLSQADQAQTQLCRCIVRPKPRLAGARKGPADLVKPAQCCHLAHKGLRLKHAQHHVTVTTVKGLAQKQLLGA